MLKLLVSYKQYLCKTSQKTRCVKDITGNPGLS